MIVELIGCAGAGKTTLRRMICERGIEGNRVLAMPDLILDRAFLHRVSHPTVANIFQEIGGLPYFLGALRRERNFVAFAHHMLGQACSTYDRLNGMRGIVRKVGMYHLARAHAEEKIVLSDEGTLLSAYNLFVMTGVDFRHGELELFARLVPLPDLVVYVRAPVASVVGRARSRPDPRRQHLGRDAAAVELDVRRTIDLFDLLVSTTPLRDRVTIVENGDLDREGKGRLAREIADWVQASVSAGMRPVPSASGSPLGNTVSGAKP